ncbi:OLD family ATP-dependent endonuclease [Klebsiella pneumoniae]|nr:OLD family ATP-dependent endonuclease [Klebsiella pneumoniae]
MIEFAQSGLKPLIKFARRMGIQWHVLVDGDEAGKKYAATVRGLLNNDRELERDHLTSLPALDMEHLCIVRDLMTFIIGWRRSRIMSR